ncbi:ABC transporter permease [Actinomadura sp. ATCC 31491]|uniref:ABC transporter permease n=1 Tax=Actinomadura luzonensis TaxID=2805427 RepID=A0ABT0G226_9ACTN|nr:ABC transporter permease [Actinomadura luzonensis]MCK2218173.1 ABC transporter permease [Actinomadura luzonensis]
MSGPLRVKLRRDLRASRSRFVLMVIAITVSLTVFGGMLSAWAAIGRETSGAYMSTEPASATIVLDRGVSPERMAAVTAAARDRPGVLEATGRAQFEGAVEVGGKALDIPLQVFVAADDDPMRMAKFDLGQQGRWPPPEGGILLGGDSLALLGVAVGDPITVQGPDGRPMRLRVAGTVYDPSLSPSPQEQRGRGYLSTDTLAVPLDQVKVQIADAGGREPNRDRDAVVAAATKVADWLQREQGLTVAEIQVPEPYAHPHQWQSDVLLTSLMAGGAAALLLSTILVATMLNTLFTQQIPQIGIMKAIGARSGAIARYYLAMTALVAAVATVIAVVPAVVIGRMFLGSLLATLGIRPASLAAPWWAYAVILAAGLGLPPLMALPPLARASRTTVRAAIDHRGAASRPGALLARLSRLPRLDRGLLMALRNTARRPARFWLSAGLLATAGAVFVAGLSLEAGADAITQEQAARRTWDVDVRLSGPAAPDAVIAAVRRVPGVTRVEALNAQPVGVAGPSGAPVTRTYPDQGHGRITLTAGAATYPKLLEGRRLAPGETGAVLISQTIRKNTVQSLAAGDSVRLFVGGRPTTWRVAGIVEERGGTSVYVTREGLAAATGRPQEVNQLRVFTSGHDEATRDAVAAAASRAVTAAGSAVTSAASISRGQAAEAGHMGPLLLVLLGIAVPLGVLGVIGLASTMSANVLDRTREFGIMHAIGARPRAVRRIVVAEGVFLALAGCVAAVGPALVLTWLLGAGLGNLFMSAPLPYRVSVPAAGIWLLLALLGAWLATDAAATRASRVTVREALACL